MAQSMYEIAKYYTEILKLSVLPISTTQKKPAINTWKRLQENILVGEDLERAFMGECKIAVIFGAISGNMECIDFDNHLNNAKEIFESFKSVIDTFGLPYETTKSGGYHVFYKCDEPVEGNKKLAMAYDPVSQKPTAIIETRGEGGYAVVSPSEGYNFTEGSFETVPTITKEERNFIISECKKFNEIIEEEYTDPKEIERMPSSYGSNDRVGDKFNISPSAIKECRQLLKDAGWTFDKDGIQCCRPGKNPKDGYSATLGKVISRAGIPQFWVFSQNASPFQADKGYTPFYVFTELAYGGDYTNSCKELADRVKSENPKKILPPLKSYQRDVECKIPDFVIETENNITNTKPVEVTDLKTKVRIEKKSKDDTTPTVDTVMEFLEARFDFRRDIITNKIEWKSKNAVTGWDTCNENNIFIDLQHYGIDYKKEHLKSLLGSKFVPDYNPFEDYFYHCKPWDGINYFSLLADYLDVEDKEFFVSMIEKQFVRAIKCALENDFYNRFVCVFRSRQQEIGKSRLVYYFNPFGDKYYSSETLTDNKDAQIALSETFIYDLDDLDDFRKVGGLGKLKAILAKRAVNVRAPYATQKTLAYRHCTFFGSTNLDEFLVDDLNTRWLIFNIRDIDKRIFTDLDVHNLWSQAWAKYNYPSFNWDLTTEEKIKREEINAMHKQSVLEQQIIAEYFLVPEDKEYTMSLMEISKRIALCSGYTRVNTDLTFIQDLLSSMGFEPRRKTVMGISVKVYNIKSKEL